jgi:type I restriction enzyme R subunit
LRRKYFRGTHNIAILLFEGHVQHNQYLEAAVPPDINQTPEQIARDQIDERLRSSGWYVQDKDVLDFSVGLGVAVREYQTDIGPADYVLFADRQAVGVVEAKPDNWGVRLISVGECQVFCV